MRKTVIVLDTETANAYVDENGKLNLNDSLTYDCGFCICDLHGEVIEEHSYVVREIFNATDMMTSAYYAEKIPQYWKQIWDGGRKVVTFMELRSILLQKIREYHVTAVVAHNARFDWNTLNKTVRYLTGSRVRYFFPYGMEIWDTLKMSNQIFAPMKKYRKFCEDNGFMTKHAKPRPRLTAEVLYRFITNDVDFEESHTGLEDVQIERVILWECLKRHKKIERRLFAD